MTAAGAAYIGMRAVCETYKISAEVVTQDVRNGLLPVFAQSAGQTWFRVADVVALFGTSRYTATEQEQ